MTKFPYAQTKKALRGVMDEIPKVGVPSTVDQEFLSSIGFGSANDQSVVKVLRFIAFVDDKDGPTETWRSFRNPRQSESVMANAIRTGYAALFALHPNAYALSSSMLREFFAEQSTASEQVITRIVNTFTTLCDYADFSQASKSRAEMASEKDSRTTNGRGNGRRIESPELPDGQPALHIDIQIHISPSADADQIDNIFKSMAKHLYSVDAN